MAGADELGNDSGADPAGRAGDENTHEKPPGKSIVLGAPCARETSMSVAAITVARMSAPVIN
jgi:hypothetical protein